jgi:SAM-dependent methyltransferase
LNDGVPVYEEVASLYDSLVGNTAFENWLAVFERLERAFHFSLRTCADVACGTGQVLSYLAGRGAKVYGVDLSRHMLDISRKRTFGLNVHLIRQDFRRLRLPRQVDLLTCNTDSLNYILSEDDLGETLARFHSSLEVGGYALFDMNTLYQLVNQQDRRIWKMREGNVRLYWRSSFDAETNIATLEMRHVVEAPHGNRLYRETHRERAYPPDRISALLEQGGFDYVYSWDAAGLGPVNDKTRRIQFLAGRA